MLSLRHFSGWFSLSLGAWVPKNLGGEVAAASEWDAEFRADLVGFLDDAVIDAAIDRARPLELPYRQGEFYRAYTDSAGGAIGGDSYSFCIAHKEDNKYVIDVIRGRPGPFDPQEVTSEYAKLCKEYRVSTVVGDLYAHQWTMQAWRDQGVTYTASDINASMLYMEALPLFSRGMVSLPNHPVLLRELRLLERIPGRVGRDQVTHPRNAHDDLANATCGCLRTLANYLGYDTSYNWVNGDDGSEQSERRVILKNRERIAGTWPPINTDGELIPNNTILNPWPKEEE